MPQWVSHCAPGRLSQCLSRDKRRPTRSVEGTWGRFPIFATSGPEFRRVWHRAGTADTPLPCKDRPSGVRALLQGYACRWRAETRAENFLAISCIPGNRLLDRDQDRREAVCAKSSPTVHADNHEAEKCRTGKHLKLAPLTGVSRFWNIGRSRIRLTPNTEGAVGVSRQKTLPTHYTSILSATSSSCSTRGVTLRWIGRFRRSTSGDSLIHAANSRRCAQRAERTLHPDQRNSSRAGTRSSTGGNRMRNLSFPAQILGCERE